MTKIKPYTTALAAISIILLLSAAIVTPSINAFAEKENGKGKNNTNITNHENHKKPKKDPDKDKDNDKRACKDTVFKKNGKYKKNCDSDQDEHPVITTHLRK